MQQGLRVDFFAVVPGRAEKGSSPIFPEILNHVFRAGNLTTSVGRGPCTVLCIVLCTVLCTVFCTAGIVSVLRDQFLYCGEQFLYCGDDFCTVGTISVLWEQFLYCGSNFCTAGIISVLWRQFMYWGNNFCTVGIISVLWG